MADFASRKKEGVSSDRGHSRTCKTSPAIARMNFIHAEIIKLAVNTFITTKISYANMLARLCEKLPEADVAIVTGALGLDSRIGSKYLNGSVSYGGPCFPRDNRTQRAAKLEAGAPDVEAIVFRDDKGAAQVCAEFGIRRNVRSGFVCRRLGD